GRLWPLGIPSEKSPRERSRCLPHRLGAVQIPRRARVWGRRIPINKAKSGTVMAQVKYLVGGPLYDPFYVFQDAIRGVLSPATTSEFTAGQAPGRAVVFKGSFTVA